MPKRKKLFSVKNNDKNIDMNVDEALYKHFQSLTPLEQKGVLNLMILELIQLMNE